MHTPCTFRREAPFDGQLVRHGFEFCCSRTAPNSCLCCAPLVCHAMASRVCFLSLRCSLCQCARTSERWKSQLASSRLATVRLQIKLRNLPTVYFSSDWLHSVCFLLANKQKSPQSPFRLPRLVRLTNTDRK